MITMDDTMKAWPLLEQRLVDDFHVAVHVRSVQDQCVPRQNGWGPQTALGQWHIVMGVDVMPDNPLASQLPVEVDSDSGEKIPVRYFYSPEIMALSL